MKHLLITSFALLIAISVSAQDSTRFSFKNEIFPVYSTVKKTLGEGLAFEVQKEVAEKSRVGLGYAKMTFGKHTARNMELLFYKESKGSNKVQVDLGFGFFVRQWSDLVRNDVTTELEEEKSLTTGYVVSLGAKTNISKSVAVATRVLFNNNTNFDLTYSLRPGIIISI